MSNFSLLEAEWPDIAETASKAESLAKADPRTACFYARRSIELAIRWLFKADSALRLPFQDNLSALIHEPTFKTATGEAIFNKARVVETLGSRATNSNRQIEMQDAMTSVRELFHFVYWLAHTYARGDRPPAGLTFDADLVPDQPVATKQSVEQLKALEAELHEGDEPLAEILIDPSALDDEIKRLQAEIAKAKKANTAEADPHDYSEAETRDFFIDLLLKEAGWSLEGPDDTEYEVQGMPTPKGQGFVDYVLWGDDGIPLALVEAKRTKKSPQIGQRQAELYANCLESKFGRRPVIFYSNGYKHWLWDDTRYPPRQVEGFYNKAELELMIQRRSTRKPLSENLIDPDIVERYYQKRATRRITESFETDSARKALLVMATGAGKTRTVIALCDLLMKCNWIKRVLFLADRVALVNQAVGAFKTHLPDSSPVNLVTEKDEEGRVYISTYPTMMGLIEERKDGERRFGVGHFDLVVIDEAHRSVYQKYRAIFEYFDSLLVGLTATPKGEVDFDTYGLFDLERGVPTDAYSLEEAVKDGFLVPPVAVSVPIKFPRSGITYDELSDEEKEQWDAIDWDEGGGVPDRVEAEAVNKWLFNKDTVDKALEHLMIRGLAVAGGDRLGKTIIFAKNQQHAEFIAERFDVNYPQYRGSFARVIHHGVAYAQSLIDDFSNPAKLPHIAISVDMLDTGIDIHEIVNLVFLKLVRSKTKFWQMVGRGTRLCPDLFGPGKDKENFFILDYCANLEFFSQDFRATEGRIGEPLGKRLFKSRLELIETLDRSPDHEEVQTQIAAEPTATYGTTLREDVASLLHAEVAAMNVENFVVRPKRELVERYSDLEAWKSVSGESITELAHEVAGLPSELEAEDEEAKRFDLLLLSLQLAVLRSDRRFGRLRDQLKAIAGLLEEKSAIPMVSQQMDLILDLQSDEWWQDVTPQMLEGVRKRLRLLVKLIDKQSRKPIYTDFTDEIGEETGVELPGFAAPDNFERFKVKARAFLRAHEDAVSIHKLRTNKPLTKVDLDDLERMLSESGGAAPEHLEKAKDESRGLGLFVRSLVGLDRGAAKEVFAGFLQDKAFGADQIEFINLIVDHLTEHGVMEAALLYESPFTDVTPHGPDGLFASEDVDELIGLLDRVRAAAQAA